jgi:cell division protein YceG involved in septum cleavage
MAVNNQSKYPLRVAPNRRRSSFQYIPIGALLVVIALSGVFILPQVITTEVRQQQTQSAPRETVANAFPVSVDPANKSIIDNPQADAFFKAKTRLSASAGFVSDILNWIAAAIDNTKLYQSLAGADGHLIVVRAGNRQEEITNQLSYELDWTPQQEDDFVTAMEAQTPGIKEGMFSPGTYVVDSSMTPSSVAALMSVTFNKNILVHYSTTTAAVVPLVQALTVASLLEREAKGPTFMRIISGIIWNRLFSNMNLQLDATLQYAKGESKHGNWWQKVSPKDKFISSAYNTYAHPGLPPGPIANPSVASVIAALNPVQTSCLFYFHDSHGNFHCSDTYAQHVKLLKKYYGQGR